YLIKFADFGIAGAAIGITAPLYLTRAIVLPVVVARQIGLPILTFYRRVLAPFIYAFSTSCITYYLFVNNLADISIPSTLMIIPSVSLIYLAFSFFLLDSTEKAFILERIRKRFPSNVAA